MRLAASGWPKMPNTPHSSLNLSIDAGIVACSCLSYAAARLKKCSRARSPRSRSGVRDGDVDGLSARRWRSVSRDPPVVPMRRRRHAGGRRRAPGPSCFIRRARHARRRFAEQRVSLKTLDAAAGEVDRRRRSRPCRSTFGQRDGEAAVGAVVRRAQQPGRGGRGHQLQQRALRAPGRAPARRRAPGRGSPSGTRCRRARRGLRRAGSRRRRCPGTPASAPATRPRSAPTTPMTGVG